MHHPTPPLSPPSLSSHIQEALNLAMHVPIRDIPAILAPLAGEDALSGRIWRHRGGGRVADKGELAFLVEPGATAGAGGEELVLEGGVDDADDGAVVENEGDGDAEHGKEVGVVYSSWFIIIRLSFAIRWDYVTV